MRRKALALVTERLQTRALKMMSRTSPRPRRRRAHRRIVDVGQSKSAAACPRSQLWKPPPSIQRCRRGQANVTVVPAVIAQLDAPAIAPARRRRSRWRRWRIFGAACGLRLSTRHPALLKTTLASADALHDDNDTVAEFILVAHSCWRLSRVFEQRRGFVSPFLSDIIKVGAAMIPPCGDESTRGDARSLHDARWRSTRASSVV